MDIIVKIIDFPTTKVTEAVTQNADGTYTIFLNAKMSAEKRLMAYLHALGHIQGNDFEKSNVQEIEYYAHKKSGSA